MKACFLKRFAFVSVLLTMLGLASGCSEIRSVAPMDEPAAVDAESTETGSAPTETTTQQP